MREELNKFTWHINGNNGLLELLFFISLIDMVGSNDRLGLFNV